MNKRRKQIEGLYDKTVTLRDKIENMERDRQFLEIQISGLEKAYNKLFSILAESGIIETEWKPTAPKGSTITPNNGYRWNEPTYTKINKVF